MYDPVRDAAVLFSDYMNLTKGMKRSKELGQGRFEYPNEITQTDMLVFAGIYSNVWQLIGKTHGTLGSEIKRQPDVFEHLRQMTVPEVPHCPNNAFRTRRTPTDTLQRVTDLSSIQDMYALCNTLRDGLSHFQYRFVNETPTDYFRRVGTHMPPGIPNIDKKDPGFRIFVYDERLTHVIDVGFAYLRLNLYNFLKFFFESRVDFKISGLFEVE